MKRPLSIVVLATVLLALLEVHAQRSEEALRRDRSRVGRVVPREERESLPTVAAIRIQAGGREFLYGRFEGLWRCREEHLAPADSGAISRLVKKLTEAEGVVVTRETDEAPTYGINTPRTVKVFLCGTKVLQDPAGDVLLAFDVGLSIPGREGAFVRRRGTREIWAIDSDPHAELDARVAPDLPPMLSPGIVPREWPGWQSGLRSVFVDGPSSGFELRRDAVEIDPSELEPGQMPWVWVLAGEEDVPAATPPTIGYTLFLQKIPYTGVLDREERSARGLDTPLHRITLVPNEGDPLVLELGPPGPDGRVCVWVDFTSTLYLLDREVARLLAPERDAFLPDREENPWDPYLRAATQPSLPALPR